METTYFEEHQGRRGCGGHHHGREESSGTRGWCERGFSRRGGFEGRHWGFGGERGRGERSRGEQRLFDAGDIRLVVLKLLAEQPSYGYQLIKTMEERLGGGYTPSAGVIYPTLTMLEEEGLASAATAENNKKVYSLTAEGKEYLQANKERVEEVFERMETVGQGFRRGRSPEIMRAFMNLRGAVAVRLHRQKVTREEIRKITDAINAAAKAIDEL